MFDIFSGSSSRRRRVNPYHGGGYYQKRGILGRFSSRSSSGGYYPQYGYPQTPYYPQSQPVNPYPQQGQANAPQAYPAAQPAAPASVPCPHCGTMTPAGSKFCLSCGAKLESAAFCPGCGKPLPPGAKFCPECGSPAR